MMKRRDIIKNLSVLPLAGAMGSGITAKAEGKNEKEWGPKKIKIPGEYETTSPLSLGDIKVQIFSALTDMKNQLEKAGTSMANVLKVHMTLAEPNKNLAPLNEVYGDFFPDPKPVRSFSGAALDQMGRDGVLVQIDCIAYID